MKSQKKFIKHFKINIRNPQSIKKELAEELGYRVSAINYYIGKGINLPNYKKFDGKGNGGRVIFPLIEVAIFLSNTIKTV